MITTDNPLYLSGQQSPETAVPVTATQSYTTTPLSMPVSDQPSGKEESSNDFIINNPLLQTSHSNASLPQKTHAAMTTAPAAAAWLKSVNEKGLTSFRHSVTKEVWISDSDQEETWYVSELTKESAWELPPP